ncbi:hypothetical protein CHUAL_005107 [Chamberlinius hualienensis]
MIFAFISAILVLSTGSKASLPACNSLKPVSFDYQKLILSSPMHMFKSTWDIYKCAKVVFVGPSADNSTYSGSSLILRGNYTFAYNFDIIDNSIFRTTLCTDGSKRDYKTVYSNFQESNSAFCAVVCNAQDETQYDTIVCLGKSISDVNDIDEFLTKTLKDLEGIQNMQANCNQPQHCDFYTN